MVGDGMGFSVLGLGQIYSETVLKTPPLYLQEAMRRGHTGLVTTRSASHLVTDSAAAATAMACGVRTANDVVGMDEAGRPLTNLFEMAQARGLAVGAVTTDRLTGATVAAFTAHAGHRGQTGVIAAQQIQNRVPVLLGGGAADFDLAEAKRAGYWLMTDKEKLTDRRAMKKPLWLGVFHPSEIPYVADRAAEVPTLSEMTAAALAKLAEDPEGFLLLVEGARIDHAAHANEAKRTIDELLEFDDAVGAVLEFVKAHSDATLFITADHDTGGAGLTRMKREDPYPRDFAEAKGVAWLSGHHTAEPVVLVGVGSDGAGAAGWHENVDVFTVIKDALGL